MKRLIVPAVALGLAIAFAQPASAGHLFGGHGCKKSGCESDCPKPACEPRCKTSCLPKLDLHRCKSACKPACPKPCEPACPKPCDPCDRGHHFGSKLKDCFGKLCHRDKGCDPCGAPAAEAGHAASAFDYNQGPRLSPTPANSTTSTRTIRRTTGF